MNFDAKVSPYALKIIYDFGFDESKISDSDFMSCRDLQSKLNGKFHDIKYLVSGTDVTISFSGRRQMELLYERVDELKGEIRSRDLTDWLRKFRYAMSKVSDSKEMKRMKRMKELKAKTASITKSLNNTLNNEAKKLLKDLPSDFSVKSVIVWDKSRTNSLGAYDATEIDGKFGGHGSVEIAMMSLFNEDGMLKRKRYKEEDDFNKDPVMGGFTSSLWQYHFMALYTHHYTNALVEYCHDELNLGGAYKRRYGTGFKMLYTQFRKEIINPILTENNIRIGKY